MKTTLLAAVAIAGLAIAANSQAQTSTTSSTTTSTNFMPTSTVIGAKVRSSDGQEIGTIKDVVLDRNTGCMAYTVLSTSGGGGTSRTAKTTTTTKTVAVPWSVYEPGNDLHTYTVRVDRERIYNAPVWEASRVDEYSRSDYIGNVYGYYGIPVPSLGVGVNTGYGASSTTTTGGYNTGTGASTGAGASTNASASPSMSTSPSMSASPS